MIAPMALTAMLLAFGAAEQSSQKQPDPKGSKPTTASQQNQPQAPPAVVQNQQASTQNQGASGQNQAQQDAEFAQKVVMWSAVAQGISAVLIVGFTWALVVYSHRGWKVAKDSADAAKASAVIAERSLTLLNRGYADTADWELKVGKMEPPLTYGMTLKFYFVNPSHSAFRIDHVDFEWLNYPLGMEGKFEPVRHKQESALGAMVTPGQRLEFGVSMGEMDKWETSSYESGAGVVVHFTGRLRYTDIFKKTRHRRFARLFMCAVGADDTISQASALVHGPGNNDEEEWDQD